MKIQLMGTVHCIVEDSWLCRPRCGKETRCIPEISAGKSITGFDCLYSGSSGAAAIVQRAQIVQRYGIFKTVQFDELGQVHAGEDK